MTEPTQMAEHMADTSTRPSARTPSTSTAGPVDEN